MSSAVVFIVAANPRVRGDRSRSATSGRIDAVLANHVGLQASLKQLGFNEQIAQKDAFHLNLLGMARLQPGQCYDSELTRWDAQERLLWQGLLHCTDAYSVHVTDSALCTAPTQAVFHSFGTSAWQSHRTLQPLTVSVALEVLQLTFLRGPDHDVHSGVSGEALARMWGEESPKTCLCVLLPVTLAFAVACGAWRRIMFSTRGTLFRTRLFSHWPPKSFHKRHAAAFVPPRLLEHASGRHMGARLIEVADDLRSWAPDILDTGGDEEDELGIRSERLQHLKAHLRFLEDCATTVDGSLSYQELVRKHPAAKLMECVRAAHLMKDVGRLEFMARRVSPWHARQQSVKRWCHGPATATSS